MSELQNFFLTLPAYYRQIKLHHKNAHAEKSDVGKIENAYNVLASPSSFSQSFISISVPSAGKSLFPLFATPVIFHLKIHSQLLDYLLGLHVGCTQGSQESCCPPAGKWFPLQPTLKERGEDWEIELA